MSSEGEDIEALEGLHVVPDVGDPALVPAEAEATMENVEELFLALEQQNGELIRRLNILGKGINPLMSLKIQIDALIDFSFDDEARKHYETACSMRLNETLKVTLAQLIGATVE